MRKIRGRCQQMYTENVEFNLNMQLVAWPDSFIFDLTRKLSTKNIIGSETMELGGLHHTLQLRSQGISSSRLPGAQEERSSNGCIPCTWAEL